VFRIIVAGVAVILGTSLSAAQTAAPAPPPKTAKAAKAAPADPLHGEARTAVAATLKDPGAAQFQNLRTRDGTDKQGQPFKVVCGEVNGKNSYGAYTGFVPWAYLSHIKMALVLGQGNVAAPDVLKTYCST